MRRRSRLARLCAPVLVAIAAACTNRPGPGEPTPLYGGCGTMRDLTPKYLLPYAPGQAWTLTQGNCGDESHGGRFRYSFDFAMPPGTAVIAARDGIVRTVRDDRPDDTGRVGDENLIIIWHDDAEMSRYIHLRRDGALVRRGQRVSAGDTIGWSGNSGRSAFPHLHFDVVDRCGSDGCRTTAAAFLNADPPIPEQRAPVEAKEWAGGS